MPGKIYGSDKIGRSGPHPGSKTIATLRSQEFLETVVMEGCSTVVCNGFIRQMEYPALSVNLTVDEIVNHIAYFQKILASIEHTKKLKTCFDRDHRTVEQKVRKHDYQGSSDLHCTQCGMTIEKGNHFKR